MNRRIAMMFASFVGVAAAVAGPGPALAGPAPAQAGPGFTLAGPAPAPAGTGSTLAGGAACRIDYKIVYQMDYTFRSEITIANRGPALRGWTLEFDLPDPKQGLIAGLEGTWSQSGALITAKSLPTNADLGTGASTMVTMVGRFTAVNPIPSKATLNGAACDGLPGATQPPKVAIVSPAQPDLPEPASFTVTADATDPDGTVTRVEFYRSSTLLGVDTQAPFSAPVANLRSGVHDLLAVAYDDSGQYTRSAIKFLTVLPPPITVTGTLVNGVEMGCVMLQADNKAYQMVARTVVLPPIGTRVEVYGQIRPDWASYCMQGEMMDVLSVKEIG